MSSREPYAPGAAAGAEVRKDGENWTLIVVRDLCHPPAKVWRALTGICKILFMGLSLWVFYSYVFYFGSIHMEPPKVNIYKLFKRSAFSLTYHDSYFFIKL